MDDETAAPSLPNFDDGLLGVGAAEVDRQMDADSDDDLLDMTNQLEPVKVLLRSETSLSSACESEEEELEQPFVAKGNTLKADQILEDLGPEKKGIASLFENSNYSLPSGSTVRSQHTGRSDVSAGLLSPSASQNTITLASPSASKSMSSGAEWNVRPVTQRVPMQVRNKYHKKHSRVMTAQEILAVFDQQEKNMVNIREEEFYQRQNIIEKEVAVKKEREFFVDDNSIVAWGLLFFGGPNYFQNFNTADVLSMDFVGCIKNNVFISSGKKLYGIGLNKYRELGERMEIPLHELTLVYDFEDPIICVSSGCTAQHLLVATTTNIYASGRNDFGQLGQGMKTFQGLPGFSEIDTTYIPDMKPSDVKKITVGATATVICGKFAEIYFCGKINDFDTTGYFVNLSQQMGGMEFMDVALGGSSKAGFMVLLSCEGQLWSVGANKHGQLGHSYDSLFAELKLVDNQNCIFEQVCASESHFAAVSSNNKLFTCGEARDGRLGRGFSPKQGFHPVDSLPDKTITSLTCTKNATIVGLENGEVHYMGDNSSAKIFPEPNDAIWIPQKLGDFNVGEIFGCEMCLFVVTPKCVDGIHAQQNLYFPKCCDLCQGRLSRTQIDFFLRTAEIHAIGNTNLRKDKKQTRSRKSQIIKKQEVSQILDSMEESHSLPARFPGPSSPEKSKKTSKNTMTFSPRRPKSLDPSVMFDYHSTPAAYSSAADLLSDDSHVGSSEYFFDHKDPASYGTFLNPMSLFDMKRDLSTLHDSIRSDEARQMLDDLRLESIRKTASAASVTDPSLMKKADTKMDMNPPPSLTRTQSTMITYYDETGQRIRISRNKKKGWFSAITYENLVNFAYKSSIGIAIQHMAERGFIWFDVGTDVLMLFKIMNAASKDPGENNLAVLWSMLFFFAIMAPYIVCWTAGLKYLESYKQIWLKAIYVLPFTGILILVLFDVILFLEAFVVNPIKLFLMLFGYELKINIPTRDQFSYSRLKTLSELFLENIVQLSLQASIWYSGQAEVLDLTYNDLVLAAGSAALNIAFQIYSLSVEASVYDKNFFDYALLILEGNFAFTPYLDSIQNGERKVVNYTQDDYGTLHLSMNSLAALRRALEHPDCGVTKILLGKTCAELKEEEKEFLWQVHDTCARRFIHLTEDLTDEMIHRDGGHVLRMAARKGYVGTVKQILNLPQNQQVDPNQSDTRDGGLTALMHACREKHYFVVRDLLDREHIKKTGRPLIDLNAQDNQHRTAMMHVVESKELDVDFVRVILDHCTKDGSTHDINIRDIRGRTALALLCLRRNDKPAIKAVNLILEKLEATIDVNLEDEDGMTPLMHACRAGNGSIVKNLVFFHKEGKKGKKGSFPIELDKRDNIGRTALHYASMEGHDMIVQFLLINHKRKGHSIGPANVNVQSIREDSCCTPLMFACDWGHEDVMDVLLLHDCDLELKDKFDRTALLRAVRGNQLVVVRRLLSKIDKLRASKDYLGKSMFDYAKDNARIRAIFAIQLKSYKLPEEDESGIDYKLEKLVNWTQYHANDEKLLTILEWCGYDADEAESRFSNVLDKHNSTTDEEFDTESMVDELLMELYLEQKKLMNITIRRQTDFLKLNLGMHTSSIVEPEEDYPFTDNRLFHASDKTNVNVSSKQSSC